MTQRRVWSDDPVVIAEGECDTMPGCDIVRARIGKRINEIEARIGHIRSKPSTPERTDFLVGLESEKAALIHMRGAVAKRKEQLSQIQGDRQYASWFSAVSERFGPEVMKELRQRANEIQKQWEEKHARGLVGSVIPVGAVGGMRRRKEET